jgi:hypothetical protein
MSGNNFSTADFAMDNRLHVLTEFLLTPALVSLVAGFLTAMLGAAFTSLTTKFVKEELAAKKQAEIIADTVNIETQSVESRIDKILDAKLTNERITLPDLASLKADLHEFIISERHVPAIET